MGISSVSQGVKPVGVHTEVRVRVQGLGQSAKVEVNPPSVHCEVGVGLASASQAGGQTSGCIQ